MQSTTCKRQLESLTHRLSFSRSHFQLQLMTHLSAEIDWFQTFQTREKYKNRLHQLCNIQCEDTDTQYKNVCMYVKLMNSSHARVTHLSTTATTNYNNYNSISSSSFAAVIYNKLWSRHHPCMHTYTIEMESLNKSKTIQ